MKLPEIYAAYPAVFCIGHDYRVMLPVNENCLMWVEVGGERFCDHTNGVLRSSCAVHSVSIPASLLDIEKKYTVVTRKVIDRTPYFPKFEDELRTEYTFRPVPEGGDVRVHCVSDTHSLVDAPVNACENSAPADLLVLNGDVPNDSGKIEHIFTIYEIAGRITKGEFPIVFSRGNHDTRGIYAESLSDYTPTDGGKSYFTFRVGSVWGMVIDCAEDKDDSCDEYGGSICCGIFRREETGFIRSIIENSANEYEAPGVTHRLVIAHSPFPYIGTRKPPFNIEKELFGEWTKLLRDEVKPTLMLFGHLHRAQIMKPHDENDFYDMLPCDAIVSGVPDHKNNTHISASILLCADGTYSSEFKEGIG